jgi:hypothetical protein
MSNVSRNQQTTQPIKPSVYAYFGGLALSLSVAAFSPNLPGFVAGTGLSTALLGFGIATATQKTDRTLQAANQRLQSMADANEREADDYHERLQVALKDRKSNGEALQKKELMLTDIQHKLTATLAELNRAKSGTALTELTAQHKAALEAVEARYVKDIAELKAAISELTTERDRSIKINKNDKTRKVDRLRELRTELNEANTLIEARETQHLADLAAVEAKAKADREALFAEFDSTQALVTTTIGELEGNHEALVSTAESEISALIEQREQLAASVLELRAQLSTVPRFGGLGTADKVGNVVIDYLASKGLQFAAVDTDADPGKPLVVTLKPVSAIAQADLQKLMGELEVFGKFYGTPTVSFKRGFYVFKVAVDKLADKPEAELKSRVSQLKKTLELANHLRIVGPSGSGKSVFLDNMIWLGKCLWTDSDLDLCDPKYPFTEWSDIQPNYKGVNETLAAVSNITERMNERMGKARLAKDNGLAIPDFGKQMLVIDEAQVAFAGAKQNDIIEGRGSKIAATFSMNLASLLGLGRALGFRGYFISQSALCSKVGLNVDTFDNAVSVFLNGAIDRALSDELKDRYQTTKLQAVEKEVDRRRALGQRYLALVSDLANDEIYVTDAPRPGFYRDLFSRENEVFRPAKEKQAKQANVSESIDSAGGSTAKSVEASEASPSPSPSLSPAIAAHCPSCHELSDRLDRLTATKTGSYKFRCQNSDCAKKTFSAKPLA